MSLNKLTKSITESSLSRLWTHNEKYDCGAITAFRIARDCGLGKAYTKNENLQRNKNLLAKLNQAGYNATKLRSKFIDNKDTLKELSFFVVDEKNSGNIGKDIARLGELYDQDSVLVIPKGSIQNKDRAYLIGTNHCKNNRIKYHSKELFTKAKLGYDSPIYTSYINGRPFIFEDVASTSIGFPNTGFGWWALHLIANKKWQDIDVGDEFYELEPECCIKANKD